MLFQPLVECSASLADVRSAACPTGNPIDHSGFFLRGGRSLSCTKVCLSVLWGQKQTRMLRGVSILRIDSARWRTYGSVIVALGIYGDGDGAEVGEGLQCCGSQFWGSRWTPGLWRHAPSPRLCCAGRCISCLLWLAESVSLLLCGQVDGGMKSPDSGRCGFSCETRW